MTDLVATRARRRAVSPHPIVAGRARVETWVCAALAMVVAAELWIGIVRSAALSVAP